MHVRVRRHPRRGVHARAGDEGDVIGGSAAGIGGCVMAMPSERAVEEMFRHMRAVFESSIAKLPPDPLVVFTLLEEGETRVHIGKREKMLPALILDGIVGGDAAGLLSESAPI